MGQIHAALVTDAKCKSGLLTKQLTQINNYQTEGLLVCVCIFGTCDAGQVLQLIQFLPQMVEEWLQFGMTSPLCSPSLVPCTEIEHCWNLHVSPSFCRRLWARPKLRFGGYFISWKELGTWRHSLCFWETANSRINLAESGATWENLSHSRVFSGNVVHLHHSGLSK